jgi:hypothetical protein
MCDYEECVAHPYDEGGWVQQKGAAGIHGIMNLLFTLLTNESEFG